MINDDFTYDEADVMISALIAYNINDHLNRSLTERSRRTALSKMILAVEQWRVR